MQMDMIYMHKTVHAISQMIVTMKFARYIGDVCDYIIHANQQQLLYEIDEIVKNWMLNLK